MQPIAKIVIGIILVIGSLYYLAFGLPDFKVKPAWPDLILLLNGAIPLFILLIGIFIIWLEWDEWKIEKELAKEEKKVGRRRRKR
jgi:hypothetical protein